MRKRKTGRGIKKAVRKPRVERTHNGGKWTQSMYFQRIRQALRNVFRYWEPAMIALRKASRPYKGSRKLKSEFQCAHCKEWFARKDVEVDHIIECGSLSCMEDIPSFIERMTPEDPNAFQVLCKAKCHPKKTKEYKQSKTKK